MKSDKVGGDFDELEETHFSKPMKCSDDDNDIWGFRHVSYLG
ncbi:MAG: hypothetical protein AAF984_02965 [Verrucomicrobiota bacterium]